MQTDSLDHVHGNYPDKWLIHTEGCIDDLGRGAPYPEADPEGFREPADSWRRNHDFYHDNKEKKMLVGQDIPHFFSVKRRLAFKDRVYRFYLVICKEFRQDNRMGGSMS